MYKVKRYSRFRIVRHVCDYPIAGQLIVFFSFIHVLEYSFQSVSVNKQSSLIYSTLELLLAYMLAAFYLKQLKKQQN